jgi:hypothetical protein
MLQLTVKKVGQGSDVVGGKNPGLRREKFLSIALLGKAIRIEITHLNETGFPPDPRRFSPRANHRWIRPRVDRENPIRNSRREMHRATVDTDCPGSEPKEMKQLPKVGFPEKIDDISRPHFGEGLFRDPDEEDWVGGELFTKFSDFRNGKRFSETTRKGVEQHRSYREVRKHADFLPRRKKKSRRGHVDSERGDEIKVAIHGVATVPIFDDCFFIVKKGRSFP